MQWLVPIAGAVCVFVPAYICAAVIARRSAFYGPLVSGKAPSRYETLDGLRGYLALGVLLHHAACNYSYYTGKGWHSGMSRVFEAAGPIAVSQFFMITGFLFWGKAIERKIGVVSLLRSRFWRLAPLYFGTVAALLLIIAVKTGFSLRVSPWGAVEEMARLGSIGMLDTAHLNGVGVVPYSAGVTWTLQYEWFFYLSLPLLVIFATPRRFLVLSAVVLAVALLPFETFYDVRVYACLFLGGMLAAHLVRWKPKLPAVTGKMAVAAIAGLVLLSVYVQGYTVRSVALNTLIFIPIVYGNNLFGLLATPASRLLGTISYSLYLCHGFVLFAVHFVLQRTVGVERIPQAVYWPVIGGASVVTVLCCVVTYRWLEHPFLRSSARKPASVPQARADLPARLPEAVPQ